MNHTYPVEQQLRHLRGDVAELDALRREFHKLQGAADVSLDLALVVARTVVERLVNFVLEREKPKLRRDLLDNIETLGSKDTEPAKRRGGRLPWLPLHLYSELHELRIAGNLVAHPFEPGSTELKNTCLTPSDLDLALRKILRLVEWVFCQYPSGPRLDTLFDAAPEEPALAQAEQQPGPAGFSV